MEAKDRIIVALDVDDVGKAIALVEQLEGHVGAFKIGLEFITSMIASLVVPEEWSFAEASLGNIRYLFRLLGEKSFWDGKFDDIPNTVGGASLAVSRMGVKMFNLHASAGREAIRRAVANKGDSLVLGVTVLTSIGAVECSSIFGDAPNVKVTQFAEMLSEEGADGIICSPQEVSYINQELRFSELLKVTPGVRPLWAVVGDQKRVMTPGEAVNAGSDYLVIGRPITSPPAEVGTPIEAAKLITEEIQLALEGGDIS